MLNKKAKSCYLTVGYFPETQFVLLCF